MPKRHSRGENGSRDLPEFATPGGPVGERCCIQAVVLNVHLSRENQLLLRLSTFSNNAIPYAGAGLGQGQLFGRGPEW